MENILARWESLSASSGIVRFLDINLRSIGQVMFQNNPLTGPLFLAAIAWGSYAAGVPRVAIAGVLAVVVANLTAQWLNADRESLHAGLYGYNGVLVGLALATFLSPNALMWIYVVLGAAVSVITMLGTANVVKPWGGPPHFSLRDDTWLLLLATYGFSGLTGAALPTSDVVTAFHPYEGSPLNLIDLLQGVFQSISQVFLKANGVVGLMFLVGLAVNSWAAAAFALAGAIWPSDGPSFRCRKRTDLRWSSGFSPVLTAIALGAVFYRRFAGRVYAMLGTLFTVIVQAALNVALTPFAIPALTAPFVLVTGSSSFHASVSSRRRLQPTMPRQRVQPRSLLFWKPTCLT